MKEEKKQYLSDSSVASVPGALPLLDHKNEVLLSSFEKRGS